MGLYERSIIIKKRIAVVGAAVATLMTGLTFACVSPASASEQGYSDEKPVPADYVNRMYWHCPVDSEMLNFKYVLEGDIVVGNFNAETAGGGHGTGIGLDVINRSHTNAGKIKVAYSCKSLSYIVGSVFNVPGFDHGITETTHTISCPDAYPHLIVSGEPLIKLKESVSLIDWSVNKEADPDALTVKLQSANLSATTAILSVACDK
ncbi:hypothetical protein [Streptomyces sp. NPDC058664]|uniref:hypothetical protein n=1 Tax=unclassified Streptomyces TaxID=2593676 RepID=UPI003666F420